MTEYSGNRVPQFQGEEKFPVWKMRFEAFAHLKGVEEALVKDNMPTKTTKGYLLLLDEKKPHEKLNLEWAKANTMLLQYLTLAFNTPELMHKMASTMSKEHPRGTAYEVMELLTEEFQPQDKLSNVEIKTKLAAISMKARENPTTLFEQIDAIKQLAAGNPNGYKNDDDEYIAQIMTCAPDEYTSVLTHSMASNGGTITISEVKNVMKAFWRLKYNLIGVGKKKKDNREGEISLLASGFGGKCYECGQTGHRAVDCPNKKNRNKNGYGKSNNNYRGGGANNSNSGRKFTGKCNGCGKVGHKAADCWMLEENKHKRPQSYKGQSGKAGAAVSGGANETEFLLAGIEGHGKYEIHDLEDNMEESTMEHSVSFGRVIRRSPAFRITTEDDDFVMVSKDYKYT